MTIDKILQAALLLAAATLVPAAWAQQAPPLPAASAAASAPSPASMPSAAVPLARVRAGDVVTGVALGERFEVPLSRGVTCAAYLTAGLDWHDLGMEVGGLDAGLRALGCNADSNALVFKLQHLDPPPAAVNLQAYQTAWEDIVGRSLADWHGHPLPIRIVSRNTDTAIVAPPVLRGTLEVAVLQDAAWRPWVGLVMVSVVWFLTILLARKTTLVRDPMSAGTLLAARTFSLARTQLAWWFAIIFASFVFLWLITGDIPALSSQALALLGIAGATTLAASAVKSPPVLQGGEADVFFGELISDANGPTIQRFQMLVMTIALGVMFLINVFTRLSMPVFDGSLITLMGISAGTYVGGKIPEVRGGQPVAPVPPEDGGGNPAPGNPPAP
jgi:hypothetical protein